MHGPSTAATLAAALWLGLAAAAPAAEPATPAESIARARALLAKDDAKGAVALLTEALPNAGAERGPMVVVLRQAYARAADQAAKAGRADEAAELREDLQILNRKLRGRDEAAKPAEAGPSPLPSAPPRVAGAGRNGATGPPASDPGAPRPSAPTGRTTDETRGPASPIVEPASRPAEPRPEPPKPDPMPAMPRFEEIPQPSPVPGFDEPKAPAIEPYANRIDPLAISDRAPTPSPVAAPARPEAKPVSRPVEPAPRDRDVARTAAPREAVSPPSSPPPVTAADVGGATPRLEPPAVPPPSRPGPKADVAPRPAAESTTAQLLRSADSAYLKGLYLDANAHYGALAKVGKLPDDRRNNWAYCRAAEVLRRINAKPSAAKEWAEIHREIAAIKALNPKFWYAEYLRNLATEESRGAPKPPKGRVVRGAMPETDEAPATPSRVRDLTRPAPAAPARPPVARPGKPGAFAMAIPPTDTPPMLTSQGDSGRWKVKESANFVIFHDDPALADRISDAAEAARDAMTRKWTGSPPPRPWSPKCELYLYPNAAIFAQVTRQPIESPGFSTMESNGSAVTGRRIKLRADAANLVEAVVPHEVTHVLLADLFPARQIPRWADEGISVLSEPLPEQEKRIGDLDAPLNGGRIFTVEALMVNDYPEGKYWPLYYAQSVSLTRFLVDQGKPGQFIDFLQGSQRNGVESELKRVYGFENYADLQARWLAYAKESSSARIAARNAETRTR
jgi:hypothetical protein